jgi:hypothetical protein
MPMTPLTRLVRVRRATAARRLAGAAAAALCAGLLAAACSSPAAHPSAASRSATRLPSAPPHGAPTVVPPTTPAAVSSSPATRPPAPAPTSAPAPAPSATVVAGAPLAPCGTAGLRVTVGAPNGAAGSIYYPIDFRNISGATCGMFGYPGVSFVSAPGGSQLGGMASRNATFGPTRVTLAPGATAHASVQVEVAQSYPAAVCKPVTAHWLRVYPPGQFVPAYPALTAATCTGSVPSGSTLGIYVVRPGATGP